MDYYILKTNNSRKGSLTVEAAIIMPFFICVILSFAFFIKIVYTHSIIQHAISQTANELSVYSYFYSVSGAQTAQNNTVDFLADKSKLAEDQISTTVEAIGSFGNTKSAIDAASDDLKNTDFEKLSDDIKEIKNLSQKNIDDVKKLKEMTENAFKNPKQEIISFASLLVQGTFEDTKSALAAPMVKHMCKKYIATENLDADRRLKSLGIENGLDGLDFSETKILYDKKNIDIIVRYKVKSGFPIDFLPRLCFIQRADVRAWLNGDGQKPGVVEPESTSTNFWKLPDGERTRRIQEAEGKDTPNNIAITKYNGGDVVDVTSINLSDKTYSETRAVKYRINSSIRKLEEFSNKEYADIKSRTLIVIIPEKSLENREDVKKLLTGDCLNYAKDRGVILKYKEGYGILPEIDV